MPILHDPTSIPPFQLLELNIISAQDLAPVSRAMRTYATAWINHDCKLSTRVDPTGFTDPTWNDKFVFRVDDSFLRSDTSAITIDIYALRCFRDIQVGTVRILISNVFPADSHLSPADDLDRLPALSFPTRFVALQIRRPSGRPQGILNIGIAVLDSSMRSMPLYTRLTDTDGLGYRDLMGEMNNDPNHHHHHKITSTAQLRKLRRTKSDFFSDAPDPKKTPPALGLKKGGDAAWSPRASSDACTNENGEFEAGSSVLEGWSDASSGVEGLHSKLERWRAELPPIYDNGFGSVRSTTTTADVARHRRSNTDGGGRLFSCFGDSFGCQCKVFCAPSPKRRGAAGVSKIHVSPSDGNLHRSFAMD